MTRNVRSRSIDLVRHTAIEQAQECAMDTVEVSLDRSKLHILLCDKDTSTGRHVMRLLQECSYQVTCVRSAGQVIEVLGSCSYQVDLILTEVELPKEKGIKMLKHIVRQEQLRRIPVVMMSAQDEMALVVKCLRLGAVDYLLKPLRMNELLNLWTHTWRRKRMLGLTEKSLTSSKQRMPFDLLLSETSESNNTNSTNFFSDGTEDFKKTFPGFYGRVTSHDIESETSPHLELSLKPSLEVASNPSSRPGLVLSTPKKTELKVGKFSAFLTYNKASSRLNGPAVEAHQSQSHIHRTHLPSPFSMVALEGKDAGEELFASSSSMIHTPLPSKMSSGNEAMTEQFPSKHFGGRNEGAAGIAAASVPNLPGSQITIGGVMKTTLQSPPPVLSPFVQLYHGVPRDDGVTNIAPGIPTMRGLQTGCGVPAFSYFPYSVNVAPPSQAGSLPGVWPNMVATPLIEHRLWQVDRREAALNKFRLKRKDRSFGKKIRYVSRKKLAEQRPRSRGQFVSRANDKDANGIMDEYDDDDDDDDDEQGFNDRGLGSSLDSIAEGA